MRHRPFRAVVMTGFYSSTLLLLLLTAVASGAQLKPGDVIFDENPAKPEGSVRWTLAPWAKIVDEGSEKAPFLRISSIAAPPSDDSQTKRPWAQMLNMMAGKFGISRPLDVESIRGWKVRVTANIRFENPKSNRHPEEEIKVRFSYQTPLLVYNDDCYNSVTGDSKWSEVVLGEARIPDDAASSGLELSFLAQKGALCIDRVRLELLSPPFSELAKEGKAYSQRTQWRGANVGGAAAFNGWIGRLASDWKLNIVRWWIYLPDANLSAAEYFKEFEALLVQLDGVVYRAEEAGIKVMPVFSMQRGNWMSPTRDGTHRIFLEPDLLSRFLKSWEILAQRYKGREGIWGYDILNEPVLRVSPAPDCLDWEQAVEKTAEVIHKQDPAARIVVEPEEWWGVQAFYKLQPVKASNVVYSVHMYAPFAMTNQGMLQRKSLGLTYPGMIGGKFWDKAALRKALQPARDFQLAYKVPMQAGEFSCVRWAPDGSAARWIKDCIDIFEEYGWDWTFHALLEWEGWNVELGDDPGNMTPLSDPPPSMKVLLEGFGKNKAVVP